MKRNRRCLSGSLAVVENCKNVLRALVKDVRKFLNLLMVVPSFGVLLSHQVLCDIGKFVSVLFEFLKSIVDALFRC